MPEGAGYTIEGEQGGAVRLVLTGPYLVSTIGVVDQELRDLPGPIAEVDLSQTTELDTVGAWLACHIATRHQAKIVGKDENAERLLKAVSVGDAPAEVAAPRLPLTIRVPVAVGEKLFNARAAIVAVVGFIGQMVLAAASVIRHPRRFRTNALVRQMELVGVSALPIVGLMSFLIGIVIAQQGAVQLRQFGAEVFTINLIGRLTLRELGLLMTAIMVAGRSGSAFAAQLGTMKLTEEIDAMRTIGVSPMEALVLPRFFAAVLLMPLLGFYASMISIIGGGLYCWAALGIPPVTFIQRIQEVVPITDLYVGLIKAPVFGAIIAMSGCYQGMQVESDAEQVGLRTTSAVVQAIFLVIVLDAFFAVFFERIGWI